MGPVTIDTLSLKCGLTNPGGNSTASSLVEPLPSTTRPDKAAVSSGVVSVGDGVIPWGLEGSTSATGLMLMFFGVGTNGQTFNANVYGWEEVLPPNTALGSGLWVPKPLVTLTGITINASIPGVLNTSVPALVSAANQYFCSAITLNLGNTGISCEILSPGSGVAEIAHAVIDGKGARFIEVRFNMNSSATSANALWKRM
jgi:hypothetical protein